MLPAPRAAVPGDVCLLLEPAEDETARLGELQTYLQSLFGGRAHEHVHLTCQRFELREQQLLPDVIQHLSTNLAAIQPFPIIASSLVAMEHRFWQLRLLRWQIQVSSDVRRFARLVEDGLEAAGATPHFSFASGWVPTLVTALEAIPKVDLDRCPSELAFPQYLFTGQRVVLSEIVGQRQFKLLETIQLRFR